LTGRVKRVISGSRLAIRGGTILPALFKLDSGL
jgi:hypothetical protein